MIVSRRLVDGVFAMHSGGKTQLSLTPQAIPNRHDALV